MMISYDHKEHQRTNPQESKSNELRETMKDSKNNVIPDTPIDRFRNWLLIPLFTRFYTSQVVHDFFHQHWDLKTGVILEDLSTETLYRFMKTLRRVQSLILRLVDFHKAVYGCLFTYITLMVIFKITFN